MPHLSLGSALAVPLANEVPYPNDLPYPASLTAVRNHVMFPEQTLIPESTQLRAQGRTRGQMVGTSCLNRSLKILCSPLSPPWCVLVSGPDALSLTCVLLMSCTSCKAHPGFLLPWEAFSDGSLPPPLGVIKCGGRTGFRHGLLLERPTCCVGGQGIWNTSSNSFHLP